MIVVASMDRPKLVRNRSVIERFLVFVFFNLHFFGFVVFVIRLRYIPFYLWNKLASFA